MSGNAYRGLGRDQDSRFGNTDAKLLKRMKKGSNLGAQEVNLKRVNIEVMSRWITERITELLGFEDEVVIGMCVNMLQSNAKLDPHELQLNLTGFLEKQAKGFVEELWSLLVDAQNSATGIPSAFLEQKRKEIASREKLNAMTMTAPPPALLPTALLPTPKALPLGTEVAVQQAVKVEDRTGTSNAILQKYESKEAISEAQEEAKLLSERLKALAEEEAENDVDSDKVDEKREKNEGTKPDNEEPSNSEDDSQKKKKKKKDKKRKKKKDKRRERSSSSSNERRGRSGDGRPSRRDADRSEKRRRNDRERGHDRSRHERDKDSDRRHDERSRSRDRRYH